MSTSRWRQSCLAAILSRSTGSRRTSPAISDSVRQERKCAPRPRWTIALWDLLGKVTGQPIAQLLGGFSRDRIRTYNTCAGTAYMRENLGAAGEQLGIGGQRPPLRRPERIPSSGADELAQDLLEEGLTAMKIWPFDLAAEANDGVDISNAELKRAPRTFRENSSCRWRQDGDHGRVPFAMAIARPRSELRGLSLPSDTKWHEDPIKMGQPGKPQTLCGSFKSRRSARQRPLASRWGLSRSSRDGRRRRDHARSLLVWRIIRGQENCGDGGGLAFADCSA